MNYVFNCEAHRGTSAVHDVGCHALRPPGHGGVALEEDLKEQICIRQLLSEVNVTWRKSRSAILCNVARATLRRFASSVTESREGYEIGGWTRWRWMPAEPLTTWRTVPGRTGTRGGCLITSGCLAVHKPTLIGDPFTNQPRRPVDVFKRAAALIYEEGHRPCSNPCE